MACHYKPYCDHIKIKKLPDTNHLTKMTGGSLSTKKTKSALIIIDVQNDFLPGGSMAIMKNKCDNGNSICNSMINSINELILSNIFDMYIFTQDAHPPGHISFASTHDKNQFDVIEVKTKSKKYSQILWPDHCRTDGYKNGINFSDKLIVPFDENACLKLYNTSSYIVSPIPSC